MGKRGSGVAAKRRAFGAGALGFFQEIFHALGGGKVLTPPAKFFLEIFTASP